jgi:tetratricopeptide (TPR) repeat protein
MDIPKIVELRQKVKESPDNPEPLLELANLYLSAKCYAEALEYLEKAFDLAPNQPNLATSIGAVAVTMGDKEKALFYFEKAVNLAPDSVACHHNLGLLCSSLEKPREAEKSFLKIIELEPNNAQAHNDLAVMFSYQGKAPEAREHYLKAIELNPFFEKGLINYLEFCLEQRDFQNGFKAAEKYLNMNPNDTQVSEWRNRFEQLVATPPEDVNIQNVIDSIRDRSKQTATLKIAFFDSQNAFGKDIMAWLGRRHEVRMFAGNTVEEIKQLLEWADLAWFEWCDQLLIEAGKLPKSCPIVCRLHSYEAFTIMPNQVDWSKVDKLILVNNSVDQILNILHPRVSSERLIIPNGVDTGRFRIPEDKKYGKNICSVGYINYKKDPLLMLQCFKAIYDRDPECRFFIAGDYQDPRYKFYFDHMIPKLGLPVQFDGWVEDIPGYFRDKDFAISTSVFESFHYSIAEGMSAGLLPLVHNWPGSENVYPEEYRFNTAEECADLVQNLLGEDRHKLVKENRLYIMKNFSLNGQLRAIDQLLDDMNIQPKDVHAPVQRNRLLPETVAKSDNRPIKIWR